MIEPLFERVDPMTDLTWAEMARESGHLFVAPPWLEVLAAAYGVKAEGHIVSHNGQRGGLAIAATEDLRGPRRCSLPFSDFADPVGAIPPAAWPGMVHALATDGPLTLRFRAGGLEQTKCMLPVWEGFWHEVDLTAPIEEIWDRIAGPARQNIRRAEREGVTIVISDELSAVEDFRRMHEELRRQKYGMLAQPPEFFRAMHDSFSPTGDLAVVLAQVDGEPIAGILLLRWAAGAYYKLNASRLEAQRYRANDLAMWHTIRHAKDWGCSTLDLGVSDLDQPGLVRYKAKYATATRTAHRVSTAPIVRTEQAAEFDRMLGLLTELATQSDAVEGIGPRLSSLLYRYFW